jgi:DNA-binding NarL/FixJ family response regulator
VAEAGDGIEATARLRILVADEHSLFREAVKVILSSEEDLVVVAEARDGLEAVAEAERCRPDIALLGAALPNGDGVKATALIKERIPDCRVLVLDDDEDEATIVRAFEAGASGYLTRAWSLSALIEATHALGRGEILIPPGMLASLLSRLIHRRRDQDQLLRRLGTLTKREREVLALLSQGLDNAGIAARLVISPETVRTHIQNVITKLGVHSRLEAVALVNQNGLLGQLVDADR